MKLVISNPGTGCDKAFVVDDEKKLIPFYEKRIGHEVRGEVLGPEWEGYILRISGGTDKQGFPMKQGVLTNDRVRILLREGSLGYRAKKKGARKRKSIRGCIVDGSLAALSLVIVKRGPTEIPGLTDKSIPRRLGPKRASNIRKLFNLDHSDDVRRYVIKQYVLAKNGQGRFVKSPKIQRLVTARCLAHRRQKMGQKQKRMVKRQRERSEYAFLMASRSLEARELTKLSRNPDAAMGPDTLKGCAGDPKKERAVVAAYLNKQYTKNKGKDVVKLMSRKLTKAPRELKKELAMSAGIHLRVPQPPSIPVNEPDPITKKRVLKGRFFFTHEPNDKRRKIGVGFSKIKKQERLSFLPNHCTLVPRKKPEKK